MMNMMKKFAAVLAATAVASVSIASISAATAMESAESAPYTASVCIQAGADAQWNPGELNGSDASITGDGSYSASVVMNNGSASLELLLLETNINAYAFAPETCSDPIAEGTVKFTIDSIVVKQVSGSEVTWDYKGPSTGAFRTSDDGKNIRFNIWNTWTNPSITDLSGDTNANSFLPSGGLASGDEIVVNFTVSGLGTEGAAGGETPATTTAPSDAAGDTATTTATDANGNPVTTTAAAGGNGSSNSSNNSSGNGNSSSGTSGNATTSQTGDFGIAAIALGAIATAALGVGAYTVTKKKK